MVSSELARTLLSMHGEVRPQSVEDWSGSFEIPGAVERFYREVGPLSITIQGGGNPYFFPRLAELWEFQAGYRWNGLNGEPIEDWNDDWLVVANQSGDPFIFERSSGAVLFAYHGEGQWDPAKMFPDLNTLAACLAQIGVIVEKAGDEFTDSDSSIRPQYRKLASTKLGELLGSPPDAEWILGVLGWG
jgi:hypothetical protein